MGILSNCNSMEKYKLFCQIEKFRTLSEFDDQDVYIRFSGVLENDFSSTALNEGVETFKIEVSKGFNDNKFIKLLRFLFYAKRINVDIYYLIDCSWNYYLYNAPDVATNYKIFKSLLYAGFSSVDDFLFAIKGIGDYLKWRNLVISIYRYDSDRCWFEIDIKQNKNSYSKFYSTFTQSEFLKVDIESITLAEGIETKDFQEVKFPSFTPNSYSLYYYYVGQGMCSLVCNENEGFIFDAGIGTPFNRKNIKNIPNEFLDRIKNLKLYFFLSHSDSDHWRMIYWNSELVDKINLFIVPHNMRHISLFDRNIKSKVRSLSQSSKIQLNINENLEILRTNPKDITYNNDGLIALFSKRDKTSLMAGDCVYSDIKKDNSISFILKKKYYSINVPHHGAFESKFNIPEPAEFKKSKAFFSAGNNKKYKHPHKDTVDDHEAKGYEIVKKNNLDYKDGIIEIEII